MTNNTRRSVNRVGRSCLKASVGVLVLFAWAHTVLAQVHLQYQNRGNRYEGIRPQPVAGYDIELLSALVAYKEKVTDMPGQLRVRFYLERSSDVYVVVREQDYSTYYWLDRVKPSRPWRQGFDNVFEWSTEDVIQALGGLETYDLGVIVRLVNPQPSQVEWVAPAILYHSRPPLNVTGYLFTFRTNGDARLTASFYKRGSAEPLKTQHFLMQRGGRPFTIRWDSSKADTGPYNLVLKGFFLDSNAPIEQTVRFSHQPVVK